MPEAVAARRDNAPARRGDCKIRRRRVDADLAVCYILGAVLEFRRQSIGPVGEQVDRISVQLLVDVVTVGLQHGQVREIVE